jgi:hypothetical protein
VSIPKQDYMDDVSAEIVARFNLAKEINKAIKKGEDLTKLKIDALEQLGLNMDDELQMLEISKMGSPFSAIDKLTKLSISRYFAEERMVFDVSGVKDIEKLLKGLMKVKVNSVEFKEVVDKDDGSVSYEEKNKKVPMGKIYSKGDILSGNTIEIPQLSNEVVDYMIANTTSDIMDIDDYPKYKAVIANIKETLYKDKKAKQLVFSLSLSGVSVLTYFTKRLFDELKINGRVMNSNSLEVDEDTNEDEQTGIKAKFQEVCFSMKRIRK